MEKKVKFSEVEREFLNNLRVARFASIDFRDNFPHVVPICFAFNGSSF